MTARKHDIRDLPYWPRFLSHHEAARYVGVSPNVFDAEVAAGRWPPGVKRGAKGGILTWDRVALDMRANADLESPADIEEQDFEARRRAAALSRRQHRHQARP